MNNFIEKGQKMIKTLLNIKRSSMKVHKDMFHGAQATNLITRPQTKWLEGIIHNSYTIGDE